ncbi:Mu transposase C-terminal domain-containing protein [Gordonia westfalica]|uniref:Mu transposase, C-terminal n=1 Tax=Gordonia westfalica TaxID=158898 RepID=A0A1H2H0C2_9ACTN|nr:Mu transposase C-terminal domain-containing protein [Gordonia westfalica]SDU25169.1 Mu transposase, C-terminal [Gordonia westfalica]
MQLRRVNLGDIISWDGRDWIVDAHGRNGSRLNPVTDGTPRWVDMATISHDGSFEYHGGSDGHLGVAADRIQLAMLDPATRADALFWLQHLTEARFGVVDPHNPDAVPRDGYGPETTIEGRMERKAQELNAAGIKTSRTSLFRKDAQYRAHGIVGLIDGRRAKESTGQKIPQIVDDAAHRVIAEHLGATTRDVLYYLDKVKQRVRHDNPDIDVNWPSDRTLRRWLTPLLDAAGLTKSAQHRRSEGNRPKRAFQPILATYPGQFVEIDSNTLDVEAVMPDGKVIRPYMTAAIDVFTDSVVGFHIHGGVPSSTDHAILFARMVSPRRAVDRIDHELSLGKSKVLPGSAMIAMGQANSEAPAMPFIAVETLTMDRGKDFLASRAAAETLGWSVIDAPPHSPTAKPHVERFFKSVNSLFLSRIDSYVGNSPEHRARAERAAIPFASLVDQMWAFIITVYQNRPHSGFVLREHPGRTFTPNQMYAASFDATAGIPLPFSDRDYIALMPRDERTIRSDGVHLGNEIYDSPELNDLRTRSGKFEVRHDPYDSERVWVRHPDTSEWITCHARSIRLAALLPHSHSAPEHRQTSERPNRPSTRTLSGRRTFSMPSPLVWQRNRPARRRHASRQTQRPRRRPDHKLYECRSDSRHGTPEKEARRVVDWHRCRLHEPAGSGVVV